MKSRQKILEWISKKKVLGGFVLSGILFGGVIEIEARLNNRDEFREDITTVVERTCKQVNVLPSRLEELLRKRERIQTLIGPTTTTTLPDLPPEVAEEVRREVTEFNQMLRDLGDAIDCTIPGLGD